MPLADCRWPPARGTRRKGGAARGASSLGGSVRRASNMHHLEKLLGQLATKQTTINIVEVGANDGRINDPIYSFVMSHKETTCVLLIEPQPELIPILKENYKEHRSVTIFNGAIGPTRTIALFRVKPALWPCYNPPYMQDAPSYRVPSGFASGLQKHVLDHARGNLPADLPLEQCIEETACSVPSIDRFRRRSALPRRDRPFANRHRRIG